MESGLTFIANHDQMWEKMEKVDRSCEKTLIVCYN